MLPKICRKVQFVRFFKGIFPLLWCSVKKTLMKETKTGFMENHELGYLDRANKLKLFGTYEILGSEVKRQAKN